jgi:thymidylate kinase
VSRPGAFIVVVGPDGSGKTSVARLLARMDRGPTGYFHFRPISSGPLSPAPEDVDQPQSKKGPGGSVLLGWVRIAVAFARFWFGYVRTIRPALRRDALVIGDRWAYGYIAQPTPLGFRGPPQLARLVIRLLPRPDLVVNLHAAPEIIHRRKQELPVAEIAHELQRWRTVATDRRLDVSAERDPETIAAHILDAVGRTPTDRR